MSRTTCFFLKTTRAGNSAMDISIIAGSAGRCLAELKAGGLNLEGGAWLPFADIAEIAVHDLDMVHGVLPKSNTGMAVALLLGGRPAWAVTSRSWTGDTLEVTFAIRTHDGREYLAKADSETFARLKDAYLDEPEEDGTELG